MLIQERIMEKDYNNIEISVRNLVEFILRSGDIETKGNGMNDPSLMQKGIKLHKKVQKSMGPNYHAEYSLSHISDVLRDGEHFNICVEGRADGVIEPDDSVMASKSYIKTGGEYEDRSIYIIDEIKGVMRDVADIEEPVAEHLGQAKCYAYFFAYDNNLAEIKIRITYSHLESELTKYFSYIYAYEELDAWYSELLSEYAKWAKFSLDWAKKRDASIKEAQFPFEYRKGQRDLVASVYTSIVRKKKLFVEAPTGIGKTISTVFPSVKAMGEGYLEKIFYLTAKTITRTAAQSAFSLLKEKGVEFKTVVITAKDKICILDKPDCNTQACERAKGHYDRVNDAVYDLITHEADISREVIMEYANKHNVCPFEMCLDTSLWVDGIICDYNYVFDPDVYLRRFFMNDRKNDYVFLVDEAHNLVDRARSMYSARLVKEDFLEAKKYVKIVRPKLAACMDAANKHLLKLKRKCDDLEVLDFSELGSLYMSLMKLMTEYDKYFKDNVNIDGGETVLDLFFSVREFVNVYEYIDDDYIVYDEFDEYGNFRVVLQCMNPSRRLSEFLSRGRASIFFSATMIPMDYYMGQLSGNDEDYVVKLPSPFDTDNRLVMIGNNVSTKYSRRNASEYDKIAGYIEDFVSVKTGNYIVFFPSYKMASDIYDTLKKRESSITEDIVMQEASMGEEQREAFLESFVVAPERSCIGFCIMGGIFSEGIDLTGDRLIGAVIVGTGLPMVCNERELFRGYFDDINGQGFNYAYLYDGMNKVMQSAGRVIRTKEDMGAILLLDERFLGPSYISLYPAHWFPYRIVNDSNMKKILSDFWEKYTKKVESKE